jgi:hypothetical protein
MNEKAACLFVFLLLVSRGVTFADILDDAVFALESTRQKLISIDAQYIVSSTFMLENRLHGALLNLDLAKENRAVQPVIDGFQREADEIKSKLDKSKDAREYSENHYHLIAKEERQYFARINASTGEPTYFSIYDGSSSRGYTPSRGEGVIEKEPFGSALFRLDNCGYVVEGKSIFAILGENRKDVSEIGEVLEEGRALLHVKIARTEAHGDYEFWLDRACSYLPRKIKYSWGREETKDIEYKTINGAQVPIRATHTNYGFGKGMVPIPFCISILKVEKIKVNDPAISVPGFEFPAGTRVWDEILGTSYIAGGAEPLVEREITRIRSELAKSVSKSAEKEPRATTPRPSGQTPSARTQFDQSATSSRHIRWALGIVGIIIGFLVLSLLTGLFKRGRA